jgi:hypothetical protein
MMGDHILGKKKPVPRDAAGNEIVKDMFVTIVAGFPIVYKVIAVDHGGITTPQGPTPTHVRVIADFSFRKIPGQPFMEMLKVALPSQEKAVESIADLLDRA